MTPIETQINGNNRYMSPIRGGHREKMETETSTMNFDPQKQTTGRKTREVQSQAALHFFQWLDLPGD